MVSARRSMLVAAGREVPVDRPRVLGVLAQALGDDARLGHCHHALPSGHAARHARARAVLVDDRRRRLGRRVAVELVVHLEHRRGVARGEALDLFDLDVRRVVRVLLAQRLEQLGSAVHEARDVRADRHDELLLPVALEHRVEAARPEDLRGLDTDHRRRPRRSPPATPSRPAPARGAAAAGRPSARTGTSRRSRFAFSRFAASNAHRSTSPRIGSTLEMTATASATRRSSIIGLIDGEVVEGRPADVHARRLPGAVGHEVAADLTARRLDRRVRLARRDAEALGEELEVVDQRLHRLVDARPRRRRDLLVLHAVVAPRHALDALAHDLDRLLDLVEPDPVPVEAVAVLGVDDVEVDLVVREVRLRGAQVPGEAGGAQDRPGDPERQRLLGGDRRRRRPCARARSGCS